MCILLCLWACGCLCRSKVNAGSLSQLLSTMFGFWVFWNRNFYPQLMFFFHGDFNLCQVDKKQKAKKPKNPKTLTGHLLELEIPNWVIIAGVTYTHPVLFSVWMLEWLKRKPSSMYGEHCLKHLPSPASLLLKGTWRCLLWGRKCLLSQSYDNQSSIPPSFCN